MIFETFVYKNTPEFSGVFLYVLMNIIFLPR